MTETKQNGLFLSATRINDYMNCPSLYERKHVQRLPPKKTGSKLFGTALHKAIEEWYEQGGEEAIPIREVWWSVFPQMFPEAWPIVRKMAIQAQVLDELESNILSRRPDLKAPRQTKEWQASKDWASWNALVREQDQFLLSESNEISFSKVEPPYKLWELGASYLDKFQTIWSGQPAPFLTEAQFTFEMFPGVYIRGVIDLVRPIVQRETGEVVKAIIDYKSGVQDLTPQASFVQSVLYAIGAEMCLDISYDLILFYSLRKGTVQPVKVPPNAIDFMLDTVEKVTQKITNHDFPKCFSLFGCKNCDFFEDCANELNIFPSEPIPASEYLSSIYGGTT